MTRLLNGVAIAAVLAIAAPAWAQGTSPSTQAPDASMSPTTSATPPMHRHVRAHHSTHHAHAAHGRMAHGSKSTANSLNRAELIRLRAGAAPPYPPSR